jgi:hypothetical protein
VYRFTIQEAGDYIVKAIVNAADSGRNSFFVGMDAEPDTLMTWDILLTTGFEERFVTWRDGAVPFKVFNLASGEHTLIIRGRELSTLLDKVEVAKVPMPTETPLPTFTAVPLDTTPPTITDITNQNNIMFLIKFSENIGTTGSNMANFGISGTIGGPVVINSISYDSNTFTTTLGINNGYPPPPDDYKLVVAGNTSITDAAGNKLDGNADGVGGDDFIHNFSVQAPTPEPPTVTPTETAVPPTFTPTPEPPTATATALPIPTATPSELVFDDQDSAFVYSSGWQNIYRRAAYNGSFKETTTNGSSVTLNFTGQAFSILYKTGREYRAMDVYVDNVLVGSINERDWTQLYQRRWDYPGQLAAGTHTLKLVFVTDNTSNKTKGSLDAVIVR